MKLYLVQHGEALTKEVDPGRPLSPQGEQDIKRLADFLYRHEVTVATVVHSGKMRAHQTAEILAEKILLRGEAEAVKGIDPNDPVEDFSRKCRQLKDDTLVVGHLPFLAKLVSYLTTGNDQPVIVGYVPGSIVCLEMDPDRNWRVSWMLRPDCIEK